MIICAAIKIKYLDYDDDTQELIICGRRHGDCFQVIKRLAAQMTLEHTQGFIDHTGKFLDRKEALEHFKACGQCNATQRWYWEDYNRNELYSEDLY